MPKLKICGLKRPQDIQYVNRFSPDYIGFVFAKSSRQVTLQEAYSLREQLNSGILSVGVFVNEKPERIEELAEKGIIDMVQLHGDESVEYVELLRQRLAKGRKKGPEIIKAIRVASAQDVLRSLDYPADFLLFDTYTKGQYGGSGQCFNWQLLKEVKRPFFLAGGLDIHKIKKAAEEVRPYGLDISSAAETKGQKDEEKIRQLVEGVRKIRLQQ